MKYIGLGIILRSSKQRIIFENREGPKGRSIWQIKFRCSVAINCFFTHLCWPIHFLNRWDFSSVAGPLWLQAVEEVDGPAQMSEEAVNSNATTKLDLPDTTPLRTLTV